MKNSTSIDNVCFTRAQLEQAKHDLDAPKLLAHLTPVVGRFGDYRGVRGIVLTGAVQHFYRQTGGVPGDITVTWGKDGAARTYESRAAFDAQWALQSEMSR